MMLDGASGSWLTFRDPLANGSYLLQVRHRPRRARRAPAGAPRAAPPRAGRRALPCAVELVVADEQLGVGFAQLACHGRGRDPGDGPPQEPT